jgi:hypothetical protein
MTVTLTDRPLFNPKVFEPAGPTFSLAPGQTAQLAVETFRSPQQLVGIALPVGQFILNREITKVLGDDEGNMTGLVISPGISSADEWLDTAAPLSYILPPSVYITDGELRLMQKAAPEVLRGRGRPRLGIAVHDQGRTGIFSLTNITSRNSRGLGDKAPYLVQALLRRND